MPFRREGTTEGTDGTRDARPERAERKIEVEKFQPVQYIVTRRLAGCGTEVLAGGSYSEALRSYNSERDALAAALASEDEGIRSMANRVRHLRLLEVRVIEESDMSRLGDSW